MTQFTAARETAVIAQPWDRAGSGGKKGIC